MTTFPNLRSFVRLSLSCLDEIDEFFQVIKLIVVAHYAFAVIYDACLLVALEAVQKFFNAISSRELGKSLRLDLLGVKALGALCGRAFITSGNTFA